MPTDVKDAGEPGIPNVTVYLQSDANNDNVGDGVIATTTTDANGNYQFSGLSAGNYLVGLYLPAGYSALAPISYLTNGSFETPAQSSFGNNLVGTSTYGGWTSSSGNFNIIKTNGSTYTGGPNNAKSGSQYVDILGASTISQAFTLGSTTNISFGGSFSSREASNYVNFTARIDIINSSNVVVATSTTRNFTSADAGEDQIWYTLSGNATLPAGTYRYVCNNGRLWQL